MENPMNKRQKLEKAFCKVTKLERAFSPITKPEKPIKKMELTETDPLIADPPVLAPPIQNPPVTNPPIAYPPVQRPVVTNPTTTNPPIPNLPKPKSTVYTPQPLNTEAYAVKVKLESDEIVDRLITQYTLCTFLTEIYIYRGIPNRFEVLDGNKAQQFIDFYLRQIGEDISPKKIEQIKKLLLFDSRIAIWKRETLPPEVWAFQDGLWNVRTKGRLSGHAGYFFTDCLSCNYDPYATCPVFDSFLKSCTGDDPNLIERIWEIIGYILSNDTRAKVFFVFAGPKDTGKSVLANTIAAVLDESAVCAMGLREIDKRFALSELADKKLAMCMDLGDKTLSEDAVGVIKSITGRDLVRAEAKYKTGRPIYIDAKMLFGTNHTLRLATADQAFADRQIIVPFRFPVPKEQQNHGLEEEMKQEAAGIAIKAMEAYLRLVANNYVFPPIDVSIPEINTISHEKVIRDFAMEMCDFTDKAARISTDALYVAYCDFAGRLKLPILEKNRFSEIFNAQNENVTRKKIKFGERALWGYEGVRLK